MAIEQEVYRPRLDPASSVPMPLQDPANDAAVTIGAGLERLGDTMHRRDVQAYQVQRRLEADREAADFAVRFAKARETFDQFSIDQRNAAPGDAAGHTEAMRTAWEAEQAKLLQGISEEGLANNARAQLAQFGERLVSSEMEWAEGKRIGKLVSDQQQLSEIGANRARRLHDRKAYAEELQAGRDTIAALNVPADVRAKLEQHHDQVVTIGFLNGLNDTNPKGAVALLDAGAFDGILDPQQIEQARNGAMVEVRREDAAAAHQQQLQAAAVRDQVQTVRTLIEGGAEVPDAQIAALQGQLTAIGDQGGAAALGVLRVQNSVRRETEPWTPAMFDAEINRLAGKEKRTDEESVRLKALRAQRPAAVATYNSNPGEWAAKNGMPPPALDLGNPDTVAQRLQWARAVQSTTGRPVAPLLPAEAAMLREQAGASPVARVQVADQLAAFGGYAALQAARQVAPNDPMLGRLAQLPDPALRRLTAKGAEIRATRKDIIDGTNGNDARADFDEQLGGAASLMAPGDLGAVFEIARNLYAARAEGGDYDDRAFAAAAHQALGGTYGRNGERLGGLGDFNRAPVLLPDGMSDATFDKTLARLGSVKFGGPNQPVWADGRAMTPAEVRRFTPVKRPDGWYEFHDGNGARVTVKGGGTWKIDLGALGRRWFP